MQHNPKFREIIRKDLNKYCPQDSEKCGGRRTIDGCRFTLAQFLGELVDEGHVDKLARRFGIPTTEARKAIESLSNYYYFVDVLEDADVPPQAGSTEVTP